jgi:hypothetical protein
MLMPLDIDATLSPLDGRAAGPSQEVEGGHCFRLMALALVAALLSIFNPKPASADMNLKLYAYNKMDWSEFQCYNWLIFKESSWNYKAVSPSGKHFGLGQMRSTWYRDLSPKKQIDAHIKYIRHRYKDGGACAALHHLETKGWH